MDTRPDDVDMPGDPLDYASGRHVKEVFDFAVKHKDLLFAARQEPVAGLLVGSQTIDWFEGRLFVGDAYKNCYHGAFQMLKELCYACKPFLDYRLDAELLRRYRCAQDIVDRRHADDLTTLADLNAALGTPNLPPEVAEVLSAQATSQRFGLDVACRGEPTPTACAAGP